MNPRELVGVGVLFNPALADFVETHLHSIDYLAVIPDRNWLDRGPEASPRFDELSAPAKLLERAASQLPIVTHSIGLSICSAGLFDRGYVRQLAEWRTRHNCLWGSDHLSFTRFGVGHESNAAVAMPSPCDEELLELIVPRAAEVQAALGCPFLLENNVAYVQFDDEEMDEATFLNALASRAGCGILLDLHNAYTNAHNTGSDARQFLSRLDLTRVVEIHVAGGDEMMGFHTDSHAGPVLEPVWELLSDIAPRLSRLKGVTFEFHESSWPLLHADGVRRQVDRAREIMAVAGTN